jgi:hypothetical protein
MARRGGSPRRRAIRRSRPTCDWEVRLEVALDTIREVNAEMAEAVAGLDLRPPELPRADLRGHRADEDNCVASSLWSFGEESLRLIARKMLDDDG